MYYPAENMASNGARFEAYVRLYEAKIESIGKNRGNWEVMEIFGNENTIHTPRRLRLLHSPQSEEFYRFTRKNRDSGFTLIIGKPIFGSRSIFAIDLTLLLEAIPAVPPSPA